MITKEEKDERLLKRGKIIFFIGLFLILFYLILLGVLSIVSNGDALRGFVYFLFVTLILVIPIVIILILQIIFGIRLLRIGYKSWGFLNLMFPALLLLYIMFGVLADSLN